MNHPAIAFSLIAAVVGFMIALLLNYHGREAIKRVYTDCMTVPEANSRVAFLFNSVASGVALIVLSIGFLFASNRDGFPTMIGTISGLGGVGSAIGRYFTKKGDGEQGPQQ